MNQPKSRCPADAGWGALILVTTRARVMTARQSCVVHVRDQYNARRARSERVNCVSAQGLAVKPVPGLLAETRMRKRRVLR